MLLASEKLNSYTEYKMNVLTYLPMRFVLTIRDFLYHWYVNSFRNMSHFMLNLFESLDKSLALRINVKSLFKPMYQDRSIFGYGIGFLYRSARIILTSFFYIVIFLISAALYLAWILLPVFIAAKIITQI